jgi:hypothetical protein
MPAHRFWCCVGLLLATSSLAIGQSADSIADELERRQLDLSTDGQTFLLNEARRASFFLVGGLHGDRETPALVERLVAGGEPLGYRFIAVEMSPWAASRAEAAFKNDDGPRLRGSDIEEVQPHLMIRDLAAANPKNRSLQQMTEMTSGGYRRSMAPQLLKLANESGDLDDPLVGGFSLRRLILKTLEVETDRLNADLELATSVRRESFMKELFVTHYRAAVQDGSKPRAIAVFGRNHLHRGYDRRGVSTLGNFIAELAAADGGQSFHLALFAAGGKISLGGPRDFDERQGDPAFAFLASLARYPATTFDLRPLRQTLRKKQGALSARDASLLYWADSYDAIVCYREVTPAGSPAPAR